MTTRAKKVLEAKVVDVDPAVEPVDAVVVDDKRNTLGRRLGLFALILLVLFFAVNGYIQSAKNATKVQTGNNRISKLIDSVDHLSQTNHDQTSLIKQLQKALREQNKLLRKAGIKTIVVPSSFSEQSSDTSSHDQRQNSSNPQPNPQPNHSPSPRPKPSHSPKPHPSPSPTKNPVEDTEDRVCSLTGICVVNYQGSYYDHYEQQALRHTEMVRSSCSSSYWRAIFCALGYLELAKW